MCKLHLVVERFQHACLATESAISLPKVLLCPGIHCMVILLGGVGRSSTIPRSILKGKQSVFFIRLWANFRKYVNLGRILSLSLIIYELEFHRELLFINLITKCERIIQTNKLKGNKIKNNLYFSFTLCK